MTNDDTKTSVPPATPETAERGGGSVQRPCSALSPEMKRCLDRMGAHTGTITRYPGGFWCVDRSELTYGTTTVEALVRRGRLEYCEWKQSHGRQFPIKARMTHNVKAQRPVPEAGVERNETKGKSNE